MSTINAIWPHVCIVAREMLPGSVGEEVHHAVDTFAEPEATRSVLAVVGIIVPFVGRAHAHAMAPFVEYGTRALIGGVLSDAHPSTIGTVGSTVARTCARNIMDIEVEVLNLSRTIDDVDGILDS